MDVSWAVRLVFPTGLKIPTCTLSCFKVVGVSWRHWFEFSSCVFFIFSPPQFVSVLIFFLVTFLLSRPPAPTVLHCSIGSSACANVLNQLVGLYEKGGQAQLLWLHTEKFTVLVPHIESTSGVLHCRYRMLQQVSGERNCDAVFFLSLQRAFWYMYSSLTNKSTYINLKTHIKIYIKIHINIAPTCFGLRPSSGSLHWTWLKLYLC